MSVSVLICDDSNLARKQMAKTLPPYWDVDVSFAANGVEGIDVIRAGKGSIVFLDLHLQNNIHFFSARIFATSGSFNTVS